MANILELLAIYTESTLTFLVFLFMIGQGELAVKVIDKLSYSPMAYLGGIKGSLDYIASINKRLLGAGIIGACVGLLLVLVYHLLLLTHLEVIK